MHKPLFKQNIFLLMQNVKLPVNQLYYNKKKNLDENTKKILKET